MKPFKKNIFIITVFVAATILFFSLSYYHNYYRFNANYDTAIFSNMLYNSVNGKLFFIAYTEENIFVDIQDENNMLARHLFILFPVVLPLFWLFPHPATALFLQVVLINLSLFPAYMLARKILKKESYAKAAVLIYLLHPILWHYETLGFYIETLAIPIIIFAAYFMHEKKWASFYISIALLLLVKETMSIMVLFLGLYLVIKKEYRQAITTMLVGALCFIISFKLILPLIAGGSYFRQSVYSNLGSSIPEMTKNAAIYIFDFSNQNPFYYKIFHALKSYLVPFSLLPLASPFSILAIPFLVLFHISNSATSFVNVFNHNFSIFMPVFFISALFAAKIILNHLDAKKARLFFAAVVLVVVLSNLKMGIFFHGNDEERFNSGVLFGRDEIGFFGSQYSRFGEELSAIPKGSDVLAERPFFLHLSQQNVLHTFHYQTESWTAEYLVFCSHDIMRNPAAKEVMEKSYMKIIEENDCFIYKRT